MKVKNDHRSKYSNLSNWKAEAWKKISASTGFEPMTSALPVRCFNKQLIIRTKEKQNQKNLASSQFPSHKNSHFQTRLSQRGNLKMSFTSIEKKIIFIPVGSQLASLWNRTLGHLGSNVSIITVFYCIRSTILTSTAALISGAQISQTRRVDKTFKNWLLLIFLPSSWIRK